MKNVVGILLAAAVGIHCSAPTQAPEPGSSQPELVASLGGGAAQTEAPQQPAPSAEDESAAKNDHAPAAADFAPLIPEGARAHVTSTVTDASGASYATGTFEGRVIIGAVAIQSKGDTDVFLLKIDAERHFQWVRSVGSGLTERGPRVTLEEGTHRVQIVGTTDGRMDCGSGELGAWSSDTFFFCVFGSTKGDAVSGGVFPTGAP
jgi:hypothetical protein